MLLRELSRTLNDQIREARELVEATARTSSQRDHATSSTPAGAPETARMKQMLACLAVLACALPVAAEDGWALTYSGSAKTYYKTGSAKPLPGSKHKVEFATRMAWPSSSSTFESVADCRTFEMTTLRTEDINSRGTKSARPHEPRVSYGWYSAHGGTGLDIHLACKEANPEAIAELQNPEVNCSPPDNAVAEVLCRRVPELSGNMNLLANVTFALKTHCNETDESTQDVFVEYMVQAIACKTNECAIKVLGDGISLVTGDLVRVKSRADTSTPVSSGSCEAVSLIKKRTADREAKKKSEETLRSYRDCLQAAIRRIDDRTSGADVVARGAHGACVDIFNEAIRLDPDLRGDGREVVYRNIEPRILSWVLEERAKPTEKKAPAKGRTVKQ